MCRIMSLVAGCKFPLLSVDTRTSGGSMNGRPSFESQDTIVHVSVLILRNPKTGPLIVANPRV